MFGKLFDVSPKPTSRRQRRTLFRELPNVLNQARFSRVSDEIRSLRSNAALHRITSKLARFPRRACLPIMSLSPQFKAGDRGIESKWEPFHSSFPSLGASRSELSGRVGWVSGYAGTGKTSRFHPFGRVLILTPTRRLALALRLQFPKALVRSNHCFRAYNRFDSILIDEATLFPKGVVWRWLHSRFASKASITVTGDPFQPGSRDPSTWVVGRLRAQPQLDIPYRFCSHVLSILKRMNFPYNYSSAVPFRCGGCTSEVVYETLIPRIHSKFCGKRGRHNQHCHAVARRDVCPGPHPNGFCQHFFPCVCPPDYQCSCDPRPPNPTDIGMAAGETCVVRLQGSTLMSASIFVGVSFSSSPAHLYVALTRARCSLRVRVLFSLLSLSLPWGPVNMLVEFGRPDLALPYSAPGGALGTWFKPSYRSRPSMESVAKPLTDAVLQHWSPQGINIPMEGVVVNDFRYTGREVASFFHSLQVRLAHNESSAWHSSGSGHTSGPGSSVSVSSGGSRGLDGLGYDGTYVIDSFASAGGGKMDKYY